MPLRPDALTAARSTAARLILLLPAQDQSFRETESTGKAKSAVPAWFPLALFLAAMAFGLGVELMPSAAPTNTVASLHSHPMEPSGAAKN
jgi:hypothetical protein